VTLTKTARPAKRTCQEITRFSVAPRGRRSRRTRRQRSYGLTTGQSPSAMSTFPRGTEGVPFVPAASDGNQKFPKSSQAAGRAFTTPGPTEPNQPLWRRKHRAGPQFPRLANDRAESVSAPPRTHAAVSMRIRLVTTSRVRLRRACRSVRASALPQGTSRTLAQAAVFVTDMRKTSRMAEVPLQGGWVTRGVVRIGDTVRRPVAQRSEFAQRLLVHLEHAGFDGAPRFLGIDERGRQILTFLPGEPVPGAANLTDRQLRSAAELLRSFHEAASTAPADLRNGCGTVVHGDVGPWNILWQGENALALIDFDEARPGEPIDDLAYFAWKGLRLNDTGPPIREQRRRLALLAEAYGIAVDDALVTAIDAAYRTMIDKGRREAWPPASIEAIRGERTWFQQALPNLR
jgi:hypothetical protein